MAEPSSTRTTFRRGWRGIRPRLIGVLLVPTIAALAFGALRMQVAVTESAEAARAESVAAALPDGFRLAVQLTVERDSAGALEPAAEREVRAQTDAAVAAWMQHLPRIDYSANPGLQADLIEIARDLERLPAWRKQLADPVSRDVAQADYTSTLNMLLGMSEHLPALEDQVLYQQADALGQVRTAAEALGRERELVTDALLTGELEPETRMELARAQGVWTAATSTFIDRTSPAARAGFEDITDGTTANGGTGAPMQAVVALLVTTGSVQGLDLTVREWRATAIEFVQQMEAVIVRAASDLADGVSATRTAAERTAIVSAVLIFLVLFAALGAAMMAARSILRPLGRLRQAALDIAHQQLPERVRTIEQADGPVDVTVRPLEIDSQDEIGEVADAFGAVHAEAVRLAGEQAQMRANVNRMFVNLSRRSKNLVERQLRLIDELEANEQDPDDLANLFRLDHLATRMRRNDESLMVLAGGDTGQGVRGNVPVLDVLRAAASEIEQFARVEVDSTETRFVRGRVAGDLVHLLAELIENATNFSPPDTTVVVRTIQHPAGGVLTVEVRDLGVGMTPEELEQANAKLRRTDQLDADVARMMGLVVTARLAHRHGLRVELTGNSPRGVIARVHVPAATLTDSAEQPTQSDQAASYPAVRPATPAATPAVQASRPEPVTAPATAESRVVTWFAKVGTGRTPASSNGSTGSSAPGSNGSGSSFTGRAGWPSLAPSALDVPAAELDDLEGEDDSPIFASLQSEWFTRRTPLGARHRSGAEIPATAGRGGGWASPADDGWRRAAEVTSRTATQPPAATAAGLPKRVPGQHLVPGSAPETPARPAAVQPRTVDPRRTRGLSSFQQGVNRARSTDPDGEGQP